MKSKTRLCGSVIFSLFMLTTTFNYGQTISKEDCFECHGDKDLTKTTEEGVEISLFVDNDKFSGSMHGTFNCMVCHSDIHELPHEEQPAQPNCSECHDKIADEYFQSFHGQALKRGNPDAPYCWDCHSTHYIYSQDDSLSMTHFVNLPATCARCHSDPKIVKKYHIPIPNPSEAYTKSIHFKAVAEQGIVTSATCSDCHGAHTLQPITNPKSMIYRFNIPKTCSKCHEEIYKVYMESVHGQSMLAGVIDSPVCTDCHSEHSIKEHTDPASTVYSTIISKTTCSRCHEAERIVTKYGLSKNVVASYNDSYHGLANRAGSVVTANCASCHGIHDIRPSSDPKSSIHKDNLPETCGKCHPGVTAQVTKGAVHLAPSLQSDKAVYYVTIFYISLIFAVIGGMVFHNGLDFFKKVRAKYNGINEHEVESLLGTQYVRLSLSERIQHFLLMTSFFILVYTGFAMVYPEAWWAAPLIRWEGAFAFRGLLHRIAAVVMIGLSIYHLIYIIFTKRGRQQIKALIPVVKDTRDVMQMFMYYLGLAKEKPSFDRYNYIEKAEYWALIWGTFVMTITGLILWFENLAMKLFPKWITDVSTVIHFYEAVLATLAIIVWHFYFQFLDPHVYPMNFTCITGKISEEDMIKEHPLEYKRLTKNSEEEND